MKRTKDLDFEKSLLEKPCRFRLSTNPAGTKDVTRLLTKLMTLQAPLELPREETASVFLALIRPCLDHWSQLQITVLLRSWHPGCGESETLPTRGNWGNMEYSARELSGWDMMQCTKCVMRMTAIQTGKPGSRWKLKGWPFHLDTRMTFSAITVVHAVQGVPQHGVFEQ